MASLRRRLFFYYLVTAAAAVGVVMAAAAEQQDERHNINHGYGRTAAASSARYRRILPGDDQDDKTNEQDSSAAADNTSGNNNNNNGGGENRVVAFFQALTGRVESDASSMWDSAPSSWELEYWEVLAIAVTVVFGILLLVCSFCCCGAGGNGNNSSSGDLPQERIIATTSQAEEYLKSKRKQLQQQQPTSDNDLSEPILEMKMSELMAQGSGSSSGIKNHLQQLHHHQHNEYSPAIPEDLEASVHNKDGILKSHSSMDVTSNTNNHDESINKGRGRSKKRISTGTSIAKSNKYSFWDKTAFVWKETVSVWGEFLGLSNEPSSSNTVIDEKDSFYKEYKATTTTTTAPAPAVPLRKKSSTRRSNRTKEIV
jgi:hypothetical protein